MQYLIKFGGNAIRGMEDLDRLSAEIRKLKEHADVALVHGGGPEITEEMEKRGLTAKKVAGQRITDTDGLKVAMDVLKDINNKVVTSMKNAGVKAEGIPGYRFIQSVKKPPIEVNENGKKSLVDLGLVGEVSSVDISVIEDILRNGVVPVIYPICAGPDGYLNVNADTAAVAVAVALKSDEMIQITDVPGVLMDVSDPSSKRDVLTTSEVDELIASGIISGGMIPKVEACKNAVTAGVKAVRMVNGKDRTIISDLLENGSHGTVIIR